MNIRDSDVLLAALDRRLQVDRIAMVDALAPAAGSADASRQPPSTPGAPDASTAAPDLVDRMPLGRSITARVVDVPRAGQVIAAVGDLRIEMAWPAGTAVRPGDDIALRVLANQPALLLEHVEVAASADTSAIDAAVDRSAGPRLSNDALRLQARPDAADGRATTPTRFDVPILATGVATGPMTGSSLDAAARIAVDVAAAYDPPTIEGADVGAIRRSNDGPSTVPMAFVPLILQGPAWAGQAMELIVHRERRDEALDDPVSDPWCGEVLIELPNLGRVAGHLAFSIQGLRLRLEGDDERSVAAMTEAAAELAHALSAADLRVSAVSVGRLATAAPQAGP